MGNPPIYISEERKKNIMDDFLSGRMQIKELAMRENVSIGTISKIITNHFVVLKEKKYYERNKNV